MNKGGRKWKDEDKNAKAGAINRLALEAAALSLRRQRLTYAEIAAELHIAVGTAFRVVKRALAKLEKFTLKEAAHVRALELESLDMAARAIRMEVQSGNLEAIDRWMKLYQRRADLMGYGPTTGLRLEGEVRLVWDDEPPSQETPTAGFVQPTENGNDEPGDGEADGRIPARAPRRPA